ncbi:MAG: HAMP domain-containing methyl-accepting chemotaxis protein [Alkalispirochaeta sp.]
MRLRTRLMIAFQSLAAIIIVAGSIGVWQIIQLNRAARVVADAATPHLYAIQNSRYLAAQATVTLTSIAAGLTGETDIERVDGYLTDAIDSAQVMVDGGTEILGQSVAASTDVSIRQTATQMIGYLERMRELAQQQMNSLNQFGNFSKAIDGNYRNVRRSYSSIASLAEQSIVNLLVAQRLQMQETARGSIIFLAVATVVCLSAAFIFAAFFARNIVVRVRSVMGVSAALAQGDFSAAVHTPGNDEVAELGNNINTAIDQLGQIIATVVQRMNVLSRTGQQLAKTSNTTAGTVQDINTIVETSREQNDDLVANVTQTSSIIEEMARNIESLDNSVQQQVSVIEESSAAIEELIASVESITQVSSRAQDQLGTLTGAADAGRDSLSRQESLVSEMADAGQSLQEANQLIAGVAGQTNLLAMNAAIEAAHAGEYGRGFAVVADEIRKLAETTSAQSNQVKKDIKSMLLLISRLVDGSATSNQSFSQIQTALEDVRSVFAEVFSAMQQQRTGGSEILEALTQMREMTGAVHDGSAEMEAGNKQMLEAIRNVNDITQQSRDAMHRIGEGMKTIAGAMTDISAVSDLNRSQIEDIISATNKLVLPDVEDVDGEGDADADEDEDAL